MASRDYKARPGLTLTCADCGRLAPPWMFAQWTVELGKQSAELILCRSCTQQALVAKELGDLSYKRRLLRIGSGKAIANFSSKEAT